MAESCLLVHREAMLGSNIDDVIATARADVPKIVASGRDAPGTIRVVEHSTNQTIVEKVSNAQGS
jgi:hypothetical protein